MDINEHNGGELTNKEIEEDLRVKGVPEKQNGYRGTQDTGNKLTQDVKEKSNESKGQQKSEP
jgi:hypothetical protein